MEHYRLSVQDHNHVSRLWDQTHPVELAGVYVLITVFDDQTNNSRHLGIVSEAMTLGLHMLRSCPFQSSALLISLALHKIKLRFPR